jgi:hypothetical protein
MSHSRLTAVFLDPEPPRQKSDLREMYDKLYIDSTPIVEDLPEEHWKTQLAENKRAFALACGEHNIRWVDQIGPVSNLQQIVHETRFADLLVLHAGIHFTAGEDSVPTETVRDILTHAECPVVVAPVSFSGISEILFAYDGTSSAMHAIKQFTYLFPSLSGTNLVYLEVNERKASNITDQQSLSDYLRLHYSAIGYQVLHGDAGKKDVFVVIGAYGRRMISLLVRPSTAESLMQPIHVPIFIAHN